ncbi:MAG: tRNA 4-thiouridine(8) synthase ThiI [Deltaproteobacteria bacterium]|nr:tRNA 4-thiouridine(8) synthase ThiI [Deltaproteobacteria bacterium]
MNIKKVKALGLSSGGLDSILAGIFLREQGIYVEWVSFETPFFSAKKAKKASEIVRIPLIIKNITKQYIKMLKNPACGYGKHINPCMDCHAFMFAQAGEMMTQKGFDFLFSGEVAGQRPMSQTKSALRYVEKKSGFDGYILRPLSAKILPETIPEKKGWIKKDNMLNFYGRSRKPQIQLAKTFNITDYPAPAGGCLLTDKGFSDRLKDLFAHQKEYEEREFHLLKHGRHIRIDEKIKIIVGRDQKDNENILSLYSKQKDILIQMKDIPGPVGLAVNGGTKEEIKTAAGICASYCNKIKQGEAVDAVINSFDQTYTIDGVYQVKKTPI